MDSAQERNSSSDDARIARVESVVLISRECGGRTLGVFLGEQYALTEVPR